MGNSESNESAAVKRQAEGLSNPMYQETTIIYNFISKIKRKQINTCHKR